MAGLCRDEERSEESAIKYFLLGAFATGFFLYGVAFVYGATGGVHLEGIQLAWAQGEATTKNLLIFGVCLMLIGLAFKTALFPFHQWTPDVYQGAPTNVTAFMAAVSKIAAVGALFRVLEAGAGMKSIWLPILTVLAILTMLVGNIIATAQKDVKRILGYSSIANAGYILCAILAHLKVPDKVTSQSLIFFLFNYAIMTIGAFAVISLLARSGKEGTRLNDLNGLWQKAPFVTATFVIFIASLIGIPPTGGFFAKLYIFNDLLTADLVPLAIVLAISSAISAYYYLAMIFAAMVSEESEMGQAKATPNMALKTTCAICAVAVFAMAIFTSPILTAMGGVQ
jgi:NADH-quinone oxidoreductase subunit N